MKSDEERIAIHHYLKEPFLVVNNFFYMHFQKYWPKEHVCLY